MRYIVCGFNFEIICNFIFEKFSWYKWDFIVFQSRRAKILQTEGFQRWFIRKNLVQISNYNRWTIIEVFNNIDFKIGRNSIELNYILNLFHKLISQFGFHFKMNTVFNESISVRQRKFTYLSTKICDESFPINRKSHTDRVFLLQEDENLGNVWASCNSTKFQKNIKMIVSFDFWFAPGISLF